MTLSNCYECRAIEGLNGQTVTDIGEQSLISITYTRERLPRKRSNKTYDNNYEMKAMINTFSWSMKTALIPHLLIEMAERSQIII